MTKKNKSNFQIDAELEKDRKIMFTSTKLENLKLSLHLNGGVEEGDGWGDGE